MRRFIERIFPSPARFLSAYADIEDHEYVDGAPARSTMANISRRRENGQLIAPPRAGNTADNIWRDDNWRPNSSPSDAA